MENAKRSAFRMDQQAKSKIRSTKLKTCAFVYSLHKKVRIIFVVVILNFMATAAREKKLCQ